MAVHDRPAAFEGSDGMSYSVELEVGETDDPARPWGAYLLFLRWRRVGAQGVEGHLETDFLTFGTSPDEARERLGAFSLGEVRSQLEALLHVRSTSSRRWWDVMRSEDLES